MQYAPHYLCFWLGVVAFLTKALILQWYTSSEHYCSCKIYATHYTYIEPLSITSIVDFFAVCLQYIPGHGNEFATEMYFNVVDNEA